MRVVNPQNPWYKYQMSPLPPAFQRLPLPGRYWPGKAADTGYQILDASRRSRLERGQINAKYLSIRYQETGIRHRVLTCRNDEVFQNPGPHLAYNA